MKKKENLNIRQNYMGHSYQCMLYEYGKTHASGRKKDELSIIQHALVRMTREMSDAYKM